MRHRTPNAIVLVLEEDQELRDGIAALLRVDGYRVTVARGEEDAARIVRSERPGLILAGVSGTEADTIAAARQTRRRAQCSQETPIVIFSARTIPEGGEKELPGRVYLARPDNFDQLRSILRRIMLE